MPVGPGASCPRCFLLGLFSWVELWGACLLSFCRTLCFCWSWRARESLGGGHCFSPLDIGLQRTHFLPHGWEKLSAWHPWDRDRPDSPGGGLFAPGGRPWPGRYATHINFNFEQQWCIPVRPACWSRGSTVDLNVCGIRTPLLTRRKPSLG